MAEGAYLKLDGEPHMLQEAFDRVDGMQGELVLDLTSVRRIDPDAVRALEKLAGRADKQGVRVVLCAVNVDVYRILKLVRLAPRFRFQA